MPGIIRLFTGRDGFLWRQRVGEAYRALLGKTGAFAEDHGLDASTLGERASQAIAGAATEKLAKASNDLATAREKVSQARISEASEEYHVTRTWATAQQEVERIRLASAEASLKEIEAEFKRQETRIKAAEAMQKELEFENLAFETNKKLLSEGCQIIRDELGIIRIVPIKEEV